MSLASSLLTALLAAPLAIIGCMTAAAADGLLLSYEIRLGGFSAGTIELDATIERTRYRVRARTEGRGLVGLLTGFRSDAHSEGALDGDAVLPFAHGADNRWLGDSRRVRIRYRSEGAPSFEAEPPPEADDRDPVPADRTIGTLDPLSAALHATLAAQAGRACEGRLDIFDGRRRYALHFQERRQEAELVRCRIALERIAGLSHDPWLPMVQPIETADLWIAPLRDGLPPIPVRLEAETGLGMAIVRLTALNGGAP